MPVALLLDIDDVLVLPVGYKQGIPATLGTFARRLGWEIFRPRWISNGSRPPG